MKEETVELCTFPEDDKYYCKSFKVPKNWLLEIIEKLDSLNERKGVDFDSFMENYVWDETWFIFVQAKKEGKIIETEEVL